MFNSPLPNMRQATTFYHTELRCVIIAVGYRWQSTGAGMVEQAMAAAALLCISRLDTSLCLASDAFGANVLAHGCE